MKSPARPLPRFLFVATAFLCAALLPAQPAGTGTIAGRVVNSIGGAALDVFHVEPLPADHKFRTLPNVVLTPHLGASTEEAQEKCGIEVAEIITSYLLTGEVRNAVNLPYLDARTYEQVKPYLTLGEKLGKLLRIEDAVAVCWRSRGPQ